ncbi:MAG: aldehyde dehydrogenase family protein [Ornithinimicrobium sp.]
MTDTQSDTHRDQSDGDETFDVFKPGTSEVVGTWPVHGPEHVRATTDAARVAAAWWSSLTFKERRKRLDRFKAVLATRSEELGRLVADETGKPTGDAFLEIALALGHIAWVGKHAGRVLGPQRTKSSLMSPHLSGEVSYRPFGVVGVIGPWNFPVFTPLGAIVSALAAGNTVVFKPSELTPGVGAWLVDAFAQVVPEHPVLQLVTGHGQTGAALVRSGVDKVAFTGSTATAKKVMAVCAESLTPMVAECGGKDALIVDEDADLDAAAEGAAWGALMNAGQACIGTERILVHERVYADFLAKLSAQVQDVRAGSGEGAKIGPMTLPSQVGVVEEHVADALSRGAQLVLGGPATHGDVVQPTILAGVPSDALANQEETFGPTMTVQSVADMDEAVRLANGTSYGLAAVVYAGAQGRRIARRLRTGMVSVNAVFATAELPSSPFGGIGDSGFGRVHGEDGLREFASPQSVVHQRFPALFALTTFQRTKRTEDLLRTVVKAVYGRS